MANKTRKLVTTGKTVQWTGGFSELLQFVNKDVSARPYLQEPQTLIRACIDDLIAYGTQLLEVESRIQGSRSASPNVKDKQRVSIGFDHTNFVNAYEEVRKYKFRFGEVGIGPPFFFDYTLRPVGGEVGTKQLLRFLEVCGRIHPGYWRKCLECGKYFIQKRLLRKTRFCGRECRDEHNNRGPERRKGKRDLARKRRSEGDPRYFK